MPEFFSVHISNDADVNIAAKRLIVEIVNTPAKKPFFGGYRNKNTGKDICDLSIYIISVIHTMHHFRD